MLGADHRRHRRLHRPGRRAVRAHPADRDRPQGLRPDGVALRRAGALDRRQAVAAAHAAGPWRPRRLPRPGHPHLRRRRRDRQRWPARTTSSSRPTTRPGCRATGSSRPRRTSSSRAPTTSASSRWAQATRPAACSTGGPSASSTTASSTRSAATSSTSAGSTSSPAWSTTSTSCATTGYNVAYWNLASRALAQSNGHVEVNGKPLRFFHYSGFDAGHPHLLSKHQNRVSLADDPVLKSLCDLYAAELRARGLRRGHQAGPTRTPPRRRALASTARCAACTARARPAARCTRSVFTARGRSPVPRAGSCSPRRAAGHSGVNRYMKGVWDTRPDLQQAYPEPFAEHAEGFLGWCDVEHRSRVANLPEVLLPRTHYTTQPSAPAEPVAPFGLNVVGYLNSELGVGRGRPSGHRRARRREGPGASRSARSRRPAARGTTTSTVGPATTRSPTTCCASTPTRPRRSPRGPAMASSRSATPSAGGGGRSRSSATSGVGAFDHVDELWAGSKFIADSLGAIAPVPVLHIPLPVTEPRPIERDRRKLDAAGGLHVPLHLRLQQRLRAQEPGWGDRGVQASVPRARRSAPRPQVHQPGQRAARARARPGRDRLAARHRVHRPLRLGRREERLDRVVRRLRVAAPLRGLRDHDGRGDALRASRHRHGLQRQHGLRAARHGVAGGLRARRDRAGRRPLPGRRRLGRPRSRPRRALHARGLRRPGRRAASAPPPARRSSASTTRPTSPGA